MGFTWTDENVAKLKQLVAEGHSYSLIGGELGCGRNAAIGKAHRLGLNGKAYSRKPTVQKPPKPRAPRREAPYRPKLSRASVDGEIILPPIPLIPALEVPKEDAMLEEAQPVSLFDLKVYSCRFPMWGHGAKPEGGGTYCGKRALDGQPFCREHYRMCYVPIPKRSPQNVSPGAFDRDQRQRRFGAGKV